MNCQFLHKSLMNYQLDQNRASSYYSYSISPLPLVGGVKFNGQRVMCESHVFLIYFHPILPSSSSVLSLSLISFFHFSQAHGLFRRGLNHYTSPSPSPYIFDTHRASPAAKHEYLTGILGIHACSVSKEREKETDREEKEEGKGDQIFPQAK